MTTRIHTIKDAGPAPEPSATARWFALAVLCVSLLIVTLDNTVLNVALPTLVSLGEMYNPVFFIGTAYAIHGDTEVPAQRIAMDIAAFFHTLVPAPGTPVYIRR